MIYVTVFDKLLKSQDNTFFTHTFMYCFPIQSYSHHYNWKSHLGHLGIIMLPKDTQQKSWIKQLITK